MSMAESIHNKRKFERADIQVSGFWSAVHPDFYIVTAFGFPAYIYAGPMHRWFGANHDMISVRVQRMIAPDTVVTVVSPVVLTDIYRRGLAGLAKWRILK